MRLKKVKLAGFKSFVDPTSIHFPSNLIGVVGPNGCGKSNIIDAVCWVMGESSAKQLRGAAMSDVIFNGSSSRKPVGRACVEIVFDNSDASFGGEYAKYSEIAIRREIGRDDGASDYFLNSANCRRRDIVDIFLGTGLGVDSYAIISQGTISQFIDAKPDELRRYLEEAAGISKYKERRRETEHRISNTRDNLNRLNDIKEEVDKQLRHLKYQANAANRYKTLKEEERLHKAQLHVLHWRLLNNEIARHNQSIHSEELKLEQKIGEQHSCDALFAQKREEQTAILDAFNAVQERYYQAGAHIARLEQQLSHHRERKEELAQELTQLDAVLTETSQHQINDQAQLESLTRERETLTLEHEKLRTLAETSSQELAQAEQAMRVLQERWDKFTEAAALNTQQVEVEQMRVKHLEQLQQEETSRLEKLRLELKEITAVTLAQEIKMVQERAQLLQQEQQILEQELEQKQQQIARQRQTNDDVASKLDNIRQQIQNLSGKCSSLQTLQQVALGKNDADLNAWLQTHQLDRKPRLLEVLQVVPGWEVAVETVLRGYLEAICVDDVSALAAVVKQMEHNNLVLLDRGEEIINGSTKAELLTHKITSAWPIHNLLFGIYAAENLADALQLRTQLEPHESIITKDGLWLGRTWLHLSPTADHKAGVLQRERELHELERLLKEKQAQGSEKEAELQRCQETLVSLEQEYHDLQEKLRAQVSAYGECQAELNAKQVQTDYIREQEERLTKAISASEMELRKMQENFATVQVILQEASKIRDRDLDERELLLAKRNEQQESLNKARENAARNRLVFDELKTRLEVLQTELGYLAQNLERNRERLQSLTEHRQGVARSLQDLDQPVLTAEKELQVELGKQLAIEKELNVAKCKVGEVDHELQSLEKRRVAAYNEIQESQQNLEQLRVVRQGLETRGQAYREQLAELGYDLNLVLPADLKVEELEQKISDLARRIERLGPINLAAIDEFTEQQKRKDYLEAQYQDLVTALSSLEGAIAKIDRDTKEKFQETFASVNEKFKNLFPKIFNGGTAGLELVGDNLLDSGVTIVAQPPGKRNSSIHLLSGGEKALTAIALVFAIFQLNPAPFCMLDEVDAPLDDLNIGRFCNLVKEMAGAVQLIFISHNKITLEMAEQLIGVTMQEAGVSRIVAVDIQDALKIAEKGNE